MHFENQVLFLLKLVNYWYSLHTKPLWWVGMIFMFSSVDPSVFIQRPTNWNKYLGHDKRWKEGGPETIGYSEAGVFRDVILVPPLSNITVSRNYVRTHSHEVCRYTQTIETKYSSMSDTCLLQSVWRRHKMNEWSWHWQENTRHRRSPNYDTGPHVAQSKVLCGPV